MFQSLKNKKNLLAYSAGTDSSALFHMLEENNIEFDLIMVNYNTREQSSYEVNHAKTLNKKLHLLNTKLDLEYGSNFEKVARDIRYGFFDEKMLDYDNLIMGHNLSDKLEWFLMQLVRGAGIQELSGMEMVSKRKEYSIVRPLLELSKHEIMKYISENKIKYFYDESNDNEKFTRNYFRHNFSEELLERNKKGILKTFKILEKEKNILNNEILIEENKDYLVYQVNFNRASNLLSKLLKIKGYLLSGAQREEFEEKEELTVVFNQKSFSATYKNNFLYISPYIKESMPKEFKEEMRKEGVPPKHRGYLYKIK